MILILPPGSPRCNEGQTYTQILKTHPPPSGTEHKCGNLFWRTLPLFSIPPSALAGPVPQRNIPQHVSFCTNPVFQRQVETTLQASPKLTNNCSTPTSLLSHGPSRSETGLPPPGRRENVPKITQLTRQAHFLDHLQSDMKSLQYAKQTNKLSHLYKNDTAYLL